MVYWVVTPNERDLMTTTHLTAGGDLVLRRYALISLIGTTAEQLCAYLPSNYEKIGFAPHDPTLTDAEVGSADALLLLGPCIVIGGEDYAGWGLDSYVIPRLQSGLHVVREIDLGHPVMRALVAERIHKAPHADGSIDPDERSQWAHNLP